MNWSDLAQQEERWRSLMNAEKNFGFYKYGKFFKKLKTISFSTRVPLHEVSQRVI